jgi:hypothetical protein
MTIHEFVAGRRKDVLELNFGKTLTWRAGVGMVLETPIIDAF